jgi:hypothetical protein
VRSSKSQNDHQSHTPEEHDHDFPDHPISAGTSDSIRDLCIDNLMLHQECSLKFQRGEVGVSARPHWRSDVVVELWAPDFVISGLDGTLQIQVVSTRICSLYIFGPR